jgi:hypothetical protein
MIDTGQFLFFFELKTCDSQAESAWEASAADAVEQILDKGYILGDQMVSQRECYAVGLSFSTKLRIAVAVHMQQINSRDGQITKVGTERSEIIVKRPKQVLASPSKKKKLKE